MERLRKFREKLSPFSSLEHRDFRLFILGFFISQLGFQSLTIAVSWQMYQLTKSALSLGMIGIVSVIPTILFSMVGGIVADKVDRKKLLIITQLGFVVVALMLGLLTYFEMINAMLIYLIIAFQFTITAFYAPVRQSIIPNIVPKKSLLNAVSLNTLARQSAIIIGPSIAGFILAFYGTEMVYFMAAGALLLMLVTLIPINIPDLVKEKMPSFDLESVKEVARFFKKSPIMMSLILLDFSATFFGSATSLLPIFAVEILQTDSSGLGLLYAADSLGGVVAGIVLSSFKKVNHQGKIIVGAVLVYGISTVVFGLSNSFIVTCMALMFIGGSDMTSTILRNNIRQLLTPDYLRGRVTGMNILFAQGGPKLGDAEAGFLASVTSAPVSVVVGGVGSIISTILIALNYKKLLRYKGDETGL